MKKNMIKFLGILSILALALPAQASNKVLKDVRIYPSEVKLSTSRDFQNSNMQESASRRGAKSF